MAFIFFNCSLTLPSASSATRRAVDRIKRSFYVGQEDIKILRKRLLALKGIDLASEPLVLLKGTCTPK
jgi:hypothetical protein